MTEFQQPTPKQKFDILNLTTGGEEEREIIEKKNIFFKAVLEDLGIDSSNPHVTQKSNLLGFEEPGYFRPTDDIIHSLEVADEVVAIVFDRRTDSNKREVTFWQREPAKEHTLEIIKKCITK